MKRNWIACMMYSLFTFFSSCFISIAHAYTPPTPEEYTWRGSRAFYPKDADLRLARNVTVASGKDLPYLSSWDNGAIVMFPVHISEDGVYDVSIVYSRYAVMQKVLRIGVFAMPEPMALSLLDKIPHFYADITTTGTTWQDYKEVKIGSLALAKGTTYLAITNADASPHEYVMNLRQLRLTVR